MTRLYLGGRKLDTTEAQKIARALRVAEYGTVDGSHHKMWVIDQIVRELTGDSYEEWVSKFESGIDGPKTYEWDVGTPP
jgi:hypothetical protein